MFGNRKLIIDDFRKYANDLFLWSCQMEKYLFLFYGTIVFEHWWNRGDKNYDDMREKKAKIESFFYIFQHVLNIRIFKKIGLILADKLAVESTSESCTFLGLFICLKAVSMIVFSDRCARNFFFTGE